MHKITERRVARCPYARAPSYLNWCLDTLGKAAGGKIILTLHVPLEEIFSRVPGGLTLSRDVVASFAPVEKPGALEHVTAVEWAPEGGGPFPKFSGLLTIAADEDYGSIWLQLEGTYDPPLGLAGKVFDAALGRRIAHETARMLLDELAAALEKTHREAVVR